MTTAQGLKMVSYTLRGKENCFLTIRISKSLSSTSYWLLYKINVSVGHKISTQLKFYYLHYLTLNYLQLQLKIDQFKEIIPFLRIFSKNFECIFMIQIFFYNNF